ARRTQRIVPADCTPAPPGPRTSPPVCSRADEVCAPRALPVAFVAGELVDPALMPGLARERRAEEDLDEVDGVGDVVHPCSERQDVRVVVGAGERGGLLAPRQRGAYTGDLV